eukprot:102672_1
MSVGCSLLTYLSTGGVIFTQNRQETIYKILQKRYDVNNPNGRNKGDRPKQDAIAETPDVAIKLFLEEEFTSENAPLRPLLKPSFSAGNSLTEETNPSYLLISNKNTSTAISYTGNTGKSVTGAGSGMIWDSFSPRSGGGGGNKKDRKKQSRRSFSKSVLKAEAQGRLELSHVITNSRLLNIFAQFLCSEFSSENLLFIIEIVQFKRCIKENENG